MVNFFHKSQKSLEEVHKSTFGSPSRASVDSTLLGSDAAPHRERNHSVFSHTSRHHNEIPEELLRPGIDTRRASASSTYSEQAHEEAQLPKEERVRLALARLRGPQYEELSKKIYGPWY